MPLAKSPRAMKSESCLNFESPVVALYKIPVEKRFYLRSALNLIELLEFSR